MRIDTTDEHIKGSDKWAVYEANIQAYRGIFLSSQAFLLAVGAILLDENILLISLLAILALLNIWYIWFRVVASRLKIVDYHKFDFKNLFNDEGEFIRTSKNISGLTETKYTNCRKIRNKVNKQMSKEWDRKPEKFHNFRLTRIKIDIIMPITYTIIWTGFIIYKLL